jgi:hypothetical protein
MENGMAHIHAMSVRARTPTVPCRDRIEEQIIRAYVRLALTPDRAGGWRSITLAQFGALEVRLSEAPSPAGHSSFPPFWVEVYSHASSCIVDSCGCFEFDEDELTAAVELVVDAQRNQPPVN